VTIRALILAGILAISAQVTVSHATEASSCTGWTSRTTPPKTIRVFRLHRKGSSVPAHIDTVDFSVYVKRVMASGAWPAYKPMESLKVGAVVIKQYAWWMILNHQSGHSWKGRCYDITDSEQYYRSNVDVHSRIKAAVNDTWSVSLRKGGRFFRTGWSGEGTSCGSRYDGWHVYEGGVTACARKGWGYVHILHRYLDPNLTIRRSV
jgi:peptidoglycan hydrolase-like amidase